MIHIDICIIEQKKRLKPDIIFKYNSGNKQKSVSELAKITAYLRCVQIKCMEEIDRIILEDSKNG